MKRFYKLLLVTYCSCQFLSASVRSEPTCSGGAGKKHQISLSLSNVRNENDEWETRFSASQNVSLKPRKIDVDLTRSVVDCRENFYINIQGIMKDSVDEATRRSLFFHSKCSSNAAITNDGMTLQKLKSGGQGSALTSRPLMDNEIFTVRIDRLDTKLDHAIGIGVTSHAPGTFDIPDHMNTLKTGAWMFYHIHLYHKSNPVLTGYLSKNLKHLKVGQRVGVMRSKSGTLHFFLDGVDQGPAASNIPDTVYGALELYGNLLQGTIVDA